MKRFARSCKKLGLRSVLTCSVLGLLLVQGACVARKFNASATKNTEETTFEALDSADNATTKAVVDAIAGTTQWQDDRLLEASDDELDCHELGPMTFNHKDREFDLQNAIVLARASFLSYKKHGFLKDESRKMGMRVDLISDAEMGTDAYVISDAKRIFVIFRGTEVKKFSDILTNLDLRKDFPWFWGRTHKGFSRAYRRFVSVRGDNAEQMQLLENRSLFAVLSEHGFSTSLWSDLRTADKSQKIPHGDYTAPNKSLFIAGHSLGGALATLLAADLTHRELAFRNLVDEKDCTKIKGTPELVTGVYTFGSPRVGDRDFATCYDAALRAYTHRVVRSNDLVAQIPIFGYWHVGQLEFIGIDGSLQHDRRVDSPLMTYLGRTFAAIKNGKSPANFSDHFVYVQPLQFGFNNKCSPRPVWKK